jgi:ElaB/YqjD/DUF883 family membrane-anchored ribosome-binding protein
MATSLLYTSVEVSMEFATTAKYWREQAKAKADGLASTADEIRDSAMRVSTLASSALDEGKRAVERSIRKNRLATEDAISRTSLLIRRRPISSLALAFASGLVMGGAALYAIGKVRKV